jgi:hypothetical protein
MLIIAALSILGMGALAAPAAAGIWTEIPSGTTSEITAIEYQSDTRFWFATSNGEIWKRRADLSGFDKVYGPSFIPFNDIEFQTGGDVGFAVGNGGVVLRSATAGSSWVDVNPAINRIPASNEGDGSGNKCTINTPLADVHFVRFAGNGRVWVGSGPRQLSTSQTNNAATVGNVGTWKDANRKVPPVPLDNCWIPFDDGFGDMFISANPDVFYIAGKAGNVVWYSTSNLTSTPQEKPSGSANGFILSGTMAGDPASPNRVWAVSGAPYGNSTAQYTEDGYVTGHWFDVVNESGHPFPSSGGAFDVDFSGGTVLSAGNAGYILHSINGREFFWNGADGALATHDWRSVGLASATQGAVGGAGGKLVVTTAANATPDIVKPTGTISGPSTAVAGQPVSFTLNAADEGGSGLNPASYAWTSAGLPAQGGQTVSFTFPSSGFFQVKVTFADNAGNTETATKSISVASAPTGPTATPALSLSGPGNSATALIVGDRVRIRMRGTVKPPAGVSTAAACNGKVRLTIKKKRKTLLRTRAALKLRSGKCRFGKTVFLPRSKAGRGTRLRLKVRFPGNALLAAGQTTKTLVVKG